MRERTEGMRKRMKERIRKRAARAVRMRSERAALQSGFLLLRKVPTPWMQPPVPIPWTK